MSRYRVFRVNYRLGVKNILIIKGKKSVDKKIIDFKVEKI